MALVVAPPLPYEERVSQAGRIFFSAVSGAVFVDNLKGLAFATFFPEFFSCPLFFARSLQIHPLVFSIFHTSDVIDTGLFFSCSAKFFFFSLFF